MDYSRREAAVENIDEEINRSEQKRRRKGKAAVAAEIMLYLIFFIVCVRIIPTYVLQRTVVKGPSMEPSLYEGENLLVEKLSKSTGQLKRFDIILFYPYGRDSDEYFIKRIIGLPGETVQIADNMIFIDGTPLSESYGLDGISYAGIADEPLYIDGGQYFVLGDNREVSFDSRYFQIGLIDMNNIEGRAILRFWPLSEFGIPE